MHRQTTPCTDGSRRSPLALPDGSFPRSRINSNHLSLVNKTKGRRHKSHHQKRSQAFPAYNKVVVFFSLGANTIVSQLCGPSPAHHPTTNYSPTSHLSPGLDMSRSTSSHCAICHRPNPTNHGKHVDGENCSQVPDQQWSWFSFRI